MVNADAGSSTVAIRVEEDEEGECGTGGGGK